MRLLIQTLIIFSISTFIACKNPEIALDNPHDPNAPVYRPSHPILAHATPVADRGVALEWYNVTSYAKGIVIEKKLRTSGTFVQVATLPPHTTTYTDSSDLILDSTYSYRVGAQGGPGIASYSDEYSIRVSFDSPGPLSIRSISESSLRVYWNDRYSFEHGFKIERAVGGGTFVEAATVAANVEYFQDTSVSIGSTYSYRVRGFTDRHFSKYTSTLKAGYLPGGVTMIRNFVMGYPATSVAFSPNEVDLAVGVDYFVKVMRMSNDVASKTIFHTSPALSVAFNPAGTYVASGGNGTTYFWRLSDDTKSAVLSNGYATTGLCFSPGGSTLAGASSLGVTVWSVPLGSQIRILPQIPVWSVAFSPDGTLLAGSSTGIVKIWNVGDGSLLRALAAGDSACTSVSFSADGLLLVVGSRDGLVRMWNVSDGTMARTWNTGTPVLSLAVSSDGNRVVTAGASDGSLSLWNMNDGSFIQYLTGHAQQATSVSFAQNGKILASSSLDGTMKVWSLGDHWWEVP